MSGSSITQGYHGHYQDGEQRHLRRQSTAALIACPFPQADQAALPVLNRKVLAAIRSSSRRHRALG